MNAKRYRTDHTHRHSGKLAVDHDHKTGKVRGLICNHCLLAQDNDLGGFTVCPYHMERAFKELQNFRGCLGEDDDKCCYCIAESPHFPSNCRKDLEAARKAARQENPH